MNWEEDGACLDVLRWGGVAEIFFRSNSLEMWVDKARGLKD